MVCMYIVCMYAHGHEEVVIPNFQSFSSLDYMYVWLLRLGWTVERDNVMDISILRDAAAIVFDCTTNADDREEESDVR